MFRTAAVLLCVTALFAPAAQAQLSRQAAASATDIATVWTRLALPDGRFPDYTSGNAATPSLGLGYALMAAGIRTDEPATIDAGLRAINFGVTHQWRLGGEYGAFDNMEVASAYNLARA